MRAISSLLLFYPFLITTFFSFFKQARKNEGACRSYVKKTTCFQTFRVIYKKTPIMDLQENTYNGDFLKQSCRPTSFKFVKKKTPRLCKIVSITFYRISPCDWFCVLDMRTVWVFFFCFGTEMILFWLFCPILRVPWYISRGFHSSATLYF